DIGLTKAERGASRLARVTGLDCGWLDRGGRPRRLCVEGLSASLRDLHRPRNLRAGATRARNPDCLAPAPDGSHGASDPSADPCRSVLSSGISVPGTCARMARLEARPPATRIPQSACRMALRPAARSDPEPRTPLRSGNGTGGGIAKGHQPA